MVRSILILLAGSGVAQLGPLLMAPLLSRLYPPEVFGVFHLASAAAANVAVVACARYEFALPMAADAAERQRLHRLSLWVLGGVVLLATAVAGTFAAVQGEVWPLAVPPTVAALAWLSLWTMRATAVQAVRALAAARMVQFWGCGLLQAALGGLQAGVWGLLIGPGLAALAAALGLRRAVGATSEGHGATRLEPPPSRQELLSTARRWREFPVLNTPHAFLGALQETLSVALIAGLAGPAAAGLWAVALRLLKAPATLAGGAVSQVLYPRLGQQLGPTAASRAEVRQVMAVLGVAGLMLAAGVAAFGPWLMPVLLGPGWEETGPLSAALSIYLGFHFIASPLGVVTLAWRAQAWALRAALVGQVVFIGLLAGVLWAGGGLVDAARALSAGMGLFFGWYFWRLAFWPVQEP